MCIDMYLGTLSSGKRPHFTNPCLPASNNSKSQAERVSTFIITFLPTTAFLGCLLSCFATSPGIPTATMAADMQWGVTPPISLSLPNESEKRANEALFAELKAQNTYEHATETAKRYSHPQLPLFTVSS